MRETLEMVRASLMQNMVEIRKKNNCFVTMLLFRLFEKVLLGLSALRAPHGGAIGWCSRVNTELEDPLEILGG